MTASAGRLREVNLELGKPTVNAAIKRLTFELHHSRSLGCAALKIIHGYGSSGTGGRIRVEARSYLARLKGAGRNPGRDLWGGLLHLQPGGTGGVPPL